MYHDAIKMLEHKIEMGTSGSKWLLIGNALRWKFIKDDVKSILSTIDCLSGVLLMAQNMDHLYDYISLSI